MVGSVVAVGLVLCQVYAVLFGGSGNLKARSLTIVCDTAQQIEEQQQSRAGQGGTVGKGIPFFDLHETYT